MNCKNGYLEALESGKPYEFIANNYTKFSKDELKDIILELTYAIMEVERHGEWEGSSDVYESVSEELKDRWDMHKYIADNCDHSMKFYTDLEEFIDYFFVEDWVKETEFPDEESSAYYKECFSALKKEALNASWEEDWEEVVRLANELAELEGSAHDFVVKEC